MIHELEALPQFDNSIAYDKEQGHIFLIKPVVFLQGPVAIIRHGETDANVRLVSQGISDGTENQLNSLGKQQAIKASRTLYKQLVDQLGVDDFQHLLRTNKISFQTSPLGRAKVTARAFSEEVWQQTGIKQQAQEDKSLIEMNFGVADGLSIEDMQEKELLQPLKMTHQYRSQHAGITFENGECFIDVMVRAITVIERLNTLFDRGAIAISLLFTHGLMASALRAVVGDMAIVSEMGRIEFRERRLEHAIPYWLPNGDISR